MAAVTDTTIQPPPKTRLSRRWRVRLPFDVWFPIAVFALMRLVDAMFIIAASRHQIPMVSASRDYYVYTPQSR